MPKEKHISAYSNQNIDYYEGVLIDLMREIGDWKRDMYLIGGLAPHYLYPEARHAGTLDIDLVPTMNLLTDSEAYKILFRALGTLGFRWLKTAERYVYWRWRKEVSDGLVIIMDMLCDTEDAQSGFSVHHSGEPRLAACTVPGANLAAQDYIEVELTSDKTQTGTFQSETIRVAGIAALLILKTQALIGRSEEKDVYDIVFCLAEEGPKNAAEKFLALKNQQDDPYLFDEAVDKDKLRELFASEPGQEGYLKEDPARYARFLSGVNTDVDTRNRRAANAIVEEFLDALERYESAPEPSAAI